VRDGALEALAALRVGDLPLALRRTAEPWRIGRVVGADRQLARVGELKLILRAGIGDDRLAARCCRRGRGALLGSTASSHDGEGKDNQSEGNSEPHEVV